MAAHRTPLPAALAARPFSSRQAVADGLPRSRLSRDDLSRPLRGVRSTTADLDFAGRLAATALAVTGDWAFSNETALRLHTLPTPLGFDDGDDLHVMRPTGANRVRRPDLVGHRGLERRTVVTIDGFPVVGPLDSLADMSGSSVYDLIAIADCLRDRGFDANDFAALLRARQGHRGILTVRQACDLAMPGSASAMESRARLRFAFGGLAVPELNAEVHDEFGGWLGTCDFVWRAARVVGEYQGDQHRSDKKQWRKDIVRVEDLQRAKWRVVLMTADDILTDHHADRLVGRLRDAGVPWSPPTIEPVRARKRRPTLG